MIKSLKILCIILLITGCKARQASRLANKSTLSEKGQKFEACYLDLKAALDSFAVFRNTAMPPEIKAQLETSFNAPVVKRNYSVTYNEGKIVQQTVHSLRKSDSKQYKISSRLTFDALSQALLSTVSKEKSSKFNLEVDVDILDQKLGFLLSNSTYTASIDYLNGCMSRLTANTVKTFPQLMNQDGGNVTVKSKTFSADGSEKSEDENYPISKKTLIDTTKATFEEDLADGDYEIFVGAMNIASMKASLRTIKTTNPKFMQFTSVPESLPVIEQIMEACIKPEECFESKYYVNNEYDLQASTSAISNNYEEGVLEPNFSNLHIFYEEEKDGPSVLNFSPFDFGMNYKEALIYKVSGIGSAPEFDNYAKYFDLKKNVLDENTWEFMVSTRKFVNPKGLDSSIYQKFSKNLQPYLESKGHYDFNNDEVQNLVKEIREELGDAQSYGMVLSTILKVLNERVTYDHRGLDFAEIGFAPAAETIKRGTGVCSNFSITFVALARAFGIPARLVGGYSLKATNFEPNDIASGEAGLHAWVEFYSETAGWWPLEPQSRDFHLGGQGYFPMGETPNDNDLSSLLKFVENLKKYKKFEKISGGFKFPRPFEKLP